MRYVLMAQLGTFLILAGFLADTAPRLAVAQALLAAVNTLLFWEVLSA